MKSPPRRFNNYLSAVVLLLLLAGCASSETKKQKKEMTALRLFLEAEYDTGDKTEVVPIYRSAPVPLRVFKEPFLDSAYLTEASLVDTMGGFAIVLRFDFHGTLVLENVTTAYRGSRIAIHAEFTDSRWLGAPRMATRITDGVLAFTPDATRTEAERIVRGLNNAAIKIGNQPKSGAKKKAT
jgi:hypothetical protein